MSPPAWAYQVDAFDPPPDEELVCSICHCIFCDPVQSPCNHVFCRSCIHKWLEMNRNCPICRKRTIRYSIQEVVPLIRNMIMKLTLHCHNSERGCESKFSLELCEGHVKECLYEMIRCKNKPCKQMVLRKDMDDHELHDCSHRYVQCKKCGLKISLVIPQKHDCIKALKLCVKEKTYVIKKKKQKIKDLQNEIKTLKENEYPQSDTSSLDSIGEAALEMNLNDMSSLSSGSSVSSTSLASNSGIDDEVNEAVSSFTFDILNGLDRRFHNASTGEYQLEDDSIEYPRDSTPLQNSSPYLAVGEASTSAFDLSTTAPEEAESPVRRPAKRRLTTALLDTSDEDEDGLARQPVPSPKRVWRFNLQGGGGESSAVTTQTSEESSGRAQGVARQRPPRMTMHNIVEQVENNGRNASRPRLTRRARTSSEENVRLASSAMRYGEGGTFERTIDLLSQYNLESDPEWVPGGSGDPESVPGALDDPESVADGSDDPEWIPGRSDMAEREEGFEFSPRDRYVTSSDESSLIDSDSDSERDPGYNPATPNCDLFSDVYSSSDDSDVMPL